MDIRKMCGTMVMTMLILLQKGDNIASALPEYQKVLDRFQDVYKSIVGKNAGESQGIRCYHCVGWGCGDRFDYSEYSSRIRIEECNGGQCTKTKNGAGFVVRSCSPMVLANEGCSEQGEFQAICACNRDLCNSATNFRPHLNFTFGAAVVICAILKIFV